MIDVFPIKLTPWLQEAFQTKENFAKVRILEYYAKHFQQAPIMYTTVMQIYSPDWRSPIVHHGDFSQINPTTSALTQQGLTQEQIWNYIADDFEE